MEKKLIVHSSFQREKLKVILLKMKLLTAFIFVGVMALSASTYSQKTKIDLRLQNSSVSEILNSIEKSSEFIFIYNANVLNTEVKKSISVKGENIEKVLELLFKDADVSYRIDDRQIFLYKKDDLQQIEKLKQNNQLQAPIEQPQKKQLKGKVTDSKGEVVPGAAVVVKGSTIGTITNFDGDFTLEVPLDAKVLAISFVGYKTQEFPIGNKTSFSVVLEEQTVGLEEVVAVGYGTQKKASVVGAITTAKGEDLQRTGGVPNLAMALTGNLPGVTTIQVSSQPGQNDPKIYIRGQSTWNGGEPYILVDGVERKMNDIDMSEVDNISVLKDASATAVYGVKGANGVILISTKRGKLGKPTLSISANSTVKTQSKIVRKLGSYDAVGIRNAAIEREVSLYAGSWNDYVPETVRERYLHPELLKYPEAYPDVDWNDAQVKPFALDHRVNINVTGGTDFAKYFSSLAYFHEGDLMRIWDNGRGYDPNLGYDRINFRTNLDFKLTGTTSLKVNLAGVFGIMNETYGASAEYGDYKSTQGIYGTAPNLFPVKYDDGYWGTYSIQSDSYTNPALLVANAGIRNSRRTDLSSDIGLTQKLDFITKGLSVSGNVSFDNHFETQGGIWDYSNKIVENVPAKYIDPAIEDMPAGGNPDDYIMYFPTFGNGQYDWALIPWNIRDEAGSLSALSRRLYYQLQANYARTFGRHDVTGTAVFTREQYARGSEFPRYREDWVGRVTYNYDGRYFAEFNGAYNGSEKFGPGYRFDFFPSAAAGWTISNERFLKSVKWLDKLKVRYSYGMIGDDGISSRWLYASQWAYGNVANMTDFANTTKGSSPYTWYKQSVIGNPNIHWEKALKTNLGLEVAVLENMLSGSVEYFTEKRTDILLAGSSRTVPVFFGADPPTANVGKVDVDGYEIELRYNKMLRNGRIWATASMTHAVDKVIYKEEPQLKDSYLLAQGFQIGQNRSLISTGMYKTWDEIYGSTPLSTSDNNKLPGGYGIIDFNSDGVVDASFDAAPYGFSTRPQNNYNFSFGADYKGFSAMLQFYGVNNVTVNYPLSDFTSQTDVVWPWTSNYWSVENPNGDTYLPRWKSQSTPLANRWMYDASYLRLKTAEIAYKFESQKLKSAGISSLKVYLNGNNLFYWSDIPDDKEQGGDLGSRYPNVKRFNLGLDIKF